MRELLGGERRADGDGGREEDRGHHGDCFGSAVVHADGIGTDTAPLYGGWPDGGVERAAWDARSDRAVVPGPVGQLLAVAGMLVLGLVGWAWTVLEDARAVLRRS